MKPGDLLPPCVMCGFRGDPYDGHELRFGCCSIKCRDAKRALEDATGMTVTRRLAKRGRHERETQ